MMHSLAAFAGGGCFASGIRARRVYIAIGVGELSPDILQVDDLNAANLNGARRVLEKHFDVKPKDAVVFIQPDGTVSPNEYELMLRRHEDAMGISPKMIFLSHKGADKTLVRSFKDTLQLLGFEPWLDEDAMVAGDQA